MVLMLASPCFNMLVWWLEGPASRSPAEIDAAFQVLARGGMQDAPRTGTVESACAVEV
jgi:hypothetical protein